jgi:hypothetical protein
VKAAFDKRTAPVGLAPFCFFGLERRLAAFEREWRGAEEIARIADEFRRTSISERLARPFVNDRP